MSSRRRPERVVIAIVLLLVLIGCGGGDADRVGAAGLLDAARNGDVPAIRSLVAVGAAIVTRLEAAGAT